MGPEGGEAHQPSPIDLFWTDTDREPSLELSKLRSYRAPHEVCDGLTGRQLAIVDPEDRLAHRLRDMQTLPFVVVANSHMSHVYELYYKAFEAFRRVREIRTVEDNDEYCKIISLTLREHLTVIPRLAMGVLECQGLMAPEAMDRFMNTLLRSVPASLGEMKSRESR